MADVKVITDNDIGKGLKVDSNKLVLDTSKDLDVNDKRITKVGGPTEDTDAVNKDFVTKAIAASEAKITAKIPTTPVGGSETPLVASTAFYTSYRTAPDGAGGNGATKPIDSNVIHLNPEKAIVFDSESTVTVPVTGLYQVTFSWNGGIDKPVKLLDNVSKVEFTAPSPKHGWISSPGQATFLVKLAAGVKARLNLSTKEVTQTTPEMSVSLLLVRTL